MRTTKILIIAIAASLLITSTVFGQTTIKQKTDQIAKEKKLDNKGELKKKGLDIKGELKKKKPKSVKKRKSNIPEIELKNSRITYEYTTFNFGLVSSGSKVSHYFPVSNTGSDTLIITKVKPT
ncbi:MAG: DUF1573 domain-containing protein [candidate division Zixibacteria bacterium]|nr:DUF1573 domain-containing protein [candidate division Zixibacteria bacterium]